MYFHKTPGFLKFLFPTLVWEKKPEKENVLFLTFDDGPVPGITEFVLDVLDKYNAKATFFCVGENMVKNPIILEKIVVAGHSLGNHTQHHLNGWKTDDIAYFEDIETCDVILDSYLGKNRKKIFRPPYGKLKVSQIREINKKNEIIMWDVLSGDFDQELKMNKCFEKIVRFSKNGSIITFHDSIKAEKNLTCVLPLYLEYFNNLGYKFFPL